MQTNVADVPSPFKILPVRTYEVVPKSFRTGRLERELQIVQLTLGAVASLFCESV